MQKSSKTLQAIMAVGIFSTASLAAAPCRADAPAPKILSICSAMNRPPMEFFSSTQQPEGIDIDLGRLLASRLNMTANFVNTPFGGLVPALLAHHCDIILSQLFIKPARLKVIDEVPYMVSQVSYILKAGTPTISGPLDLSGQKVAVVLGSTSVDFLTAANVTLNAQHKAPITILPFSENTSALQQVQFGQVAAYGVAYETALYYANLQPGVFEVGSPPFGKIATGVGINKNEAALEQILTVALHGLMRDGSYAAIFKKWQLQDDMLTP